MTNDGNQRGWNRELLWCAGWAGMGVALTLMAGLLTGVPIEQTAHGAEHRAGGLHFVRIGDAPPDDGAKAAPPGGNADGTQVTVDNFTFTPKMAAVAVGTTVTWTNHDDIPHNVVSPERKFKSPVLDTDETFSYRFDMPGTYQYYCSIHPRMTGQVVVR